MKCSFLSTTNFMSFVLCMLVVLRSFTFGTELNARNCTVSVEKKSPLLDHVESTAQLASKGKEPAATRALLMSILSKKVMQALSRKRRESIKRKKQMDGNGVDESKSCTDWILDGDLNLVESFERKSSGSANCRKNKGKAREVRAMVARGLFGLNSSHLPKSGAIEKNVSEAIIVQSVPAKSSNYGSPTTPFISLSIFKEDTPSNQSFAVTDEESTTKAAALSSPPSTSPSSPSFYLSKENPRYCEVNTDCHLNLNERCVPDGGTYSVCSCVSPFVRNLQTMECEITKGIQIILRFGSTPFSAPLNNPNSPAFIRLKNLTEKLIWSIVQLANTLPKSVRDLKVLKFTNGSLIANLIMLIDSSLYKKPISTLKLAIVSELAVAINNLNQSAATPSEALLDYRHLTIEEIDASIDPCQIEELNYCSINAYCKTNTSLKAYLPSFTCSCKSGYTDTSLNLDYLGESCNIVCPQSYCSHDGYCHIGDENKGLYCTCQNWNIGDRCQYSGVIVLGVLGLVVFMLMLVVACTTSAFCSRSRRDIVSDGQGHNNQQQQQESPQCNRLVIENSYETNNGNHMKNKDRIMTVEEKIAAAESDTYHLHNPTRLSQSYLNDPLRRPSTPTVNAAVQTLSIMSNSPPTQHGDLLNSPCGEMSKNLYQTPKPLQVPNYKARHNPSSQQQMQVTWF